MNQHPYRRSGSRSLMLVTTVLVAAGTLTATAFFNPFKAKRRAMAIEKLNNSRQAKLAMDVFAMDNDGVYPSVDTAELHEIPVKNGSSNEFFRQLFATGCINSERLFWVENAKVCNKAAPDDEFNKNDEFQVAECLQAGDCGWAYVTGQTNTDNPARPIILDAFLPGTTDFDKDTWDGKVAVVHIDGSARLVDLDPLGKAIVDGEDLLSPKSDLWKKAGLDPLKLLAQPLPAKAPEQKEKGAGVAE